MNTRPLLQWKCWHLKGFLNITVYFGLNYFRYLGNIWCNYFMILNVYNQCKLFNTIYCVLSNIWRFFPIKSRTGKEDSTLQLPGRSDDSKAVQETANSFDFRTSSTKADRGSSQPDPGIRYSTVRHDRPPRTSGRRTGLHDQGCPEGTVYPCQDFIILVVVVVVVVDVVVVLLLFTNIYQVKYCGFTEFYKILIFFHSKNCWQWFPKRVLVFFKLLL